MTDKQIIDDYRVDLVHKNTLFSLKSISNHLDIWKNYSESEKIKLENITYRDSIVNKNFQYSQGYDSNLTYGEITKDGIEKLIEKINRYKNISNKDVFVDIGSGCGKLALHLGLKTNIKTIVGVEILDIRVKYSKYIQEQVDVKSVFFINKDVLDFDLSISTIIFINGAFFDDILFEKILDKIPKGCHVILDRSCDFNILNETFNLNVSWSKKECEYFYYIK